MAAKIAVWAGEKGGGGKTTNIINVGCYLKEEGNKVLIVDVDPNKSASSWGVKAGEKGPAVVNITENLKDNVTKLKPHFDYILIDCEGSLNQTTLDAIKVTDAVIIPYQPSPLDIWGNASLVELIEARQQITEGKPAAALLLNAYDKRNKISKITLESLKDHVIPMLPVKTSRLTDYVVTLVDGDSVVNLGEDNQAAFETRKLTKAILELLA